MRPPPYALSHLTQYQACVLLQAKAWPVSPGLNDVVVRLEHYSNLAIDNIPSEGKHIKVCTCSQTFASVCIHLGQRSAVAPRCASSCSAWQICLPPVRRQDRPPRCSTPQYAQLLIGVVMQTFYQGRKWSLSMTLETDEIQAGAAAVLLYCWDVYR